MVHTCLVLSFKEMYRINKQLKGLVILKHLLGMNNYLGINSNKLCLSNKLMLEKFCKWELNLHLVKK